MYHALRINKDKLDKHARSKRRQRRENHLVAAWLVRGEKPHAARATQLRRVRRRVSRKRGDWELELAIGALRARLYLHGLHMKWGDCRGHARDGSKATKGRCERKSVGKEETMKGGGDGMHAEGRWWCTRRKRRGGRRGKRETRRERHALLTETNPSQEHVQLPHEQVEEWEAEPGGGFIRNMGEKGGEGEGIQVPTTEFWKELTRKLGKVKRVWGDGNCWLWAVMNALREVEHEYPIVPTDNDIRKEREWRGRVADTMLANGESQVRAGTIRMGSAQWTGDRFIMGVWGGERELRALAMWRNVNIAIWNARSVRGDVARVYMADGKERHLNKETVDMIAVDHRREQGISTIPYIWYIIVNTTNR